MGYVHGGKATLAAMQYLRWVDSDLVKHQFAIEILYGLTSPGFVDSQNIHLQSPFSARDPPTTGPIAAAHDQVLHKESYCLITT